MRYQVIVTLDEDVVRRYIVEDARDASIAVDVVHEHMDDLINVSVTAMNRPYDETDYDAVLDASADDDEDLGEDSR